MYRVGVNLLTLTEIADELGVTRQRVHQFVTEKRLKAATILGRRGVKPAEFERFKRVQRKTGRPRKSNGHNKLQSNGVSD